jgi:hypothetical protein
MNKPLFILAIGLAVLAPAQEVQTGSASSLQGLRIKFPLACVDGYVITWVAANNRFECLAGGAGGGSPSFAAITPGTNSGALVMGAGGSLSATGGGTITATGLAAGATGVDLTLTGSIISGSGTGVAGVLDLGQGTLPSSFPANSFSLYTPTSIPTSYRWRLPSADAAGAIVSDGGGTPGILSIVGFNGTGNILKSAGTAAIASGKTLTASNSLTFTGTDGTTVAFPLTSANIATANTRRVCSIIVGAENGSALADADIAPQGRQCYVPFAATVVELMVAADAGTPSVVVRRNRAGTGANFISSALATAASGGLACSNTGGTTGLDGATSCSATLQNTGLTAGDWIELVSGTAGGVAKRMSIAVTYTVN